MSGTVYLITGANRGIGLALVSRILVLHEDAFVYAAVRDPKGGTALQELQAKYPGRVAIVRCVYADVDGNAALAKEIEKRHGRVDTVVSNAGIAVNNAAPVSETALSTLEDHFRVNVFGHVVLFQAVFNLLKKSKTPRFVTVSSEAGSLVGDAVKLPTIGHVSYGSSKAALNWVTRKIHFENDWLVAFPITPGPVKTDMLTSTADKDTSGVFDGILDGAAKPDDVAVFLVDLIDISSRKVHGGEFFSFNGEKSAW